jgi:hypothetical protein
VHVPYEEVYGRGFADTRRRVPAIAKAQELLSWEATIDPDEGLQLILAERTAAA